MCTGPGCPTRKYLYDIKVVKGIDARKELDSELSSGSPTEYSSKKVRLRKVLSDSNLQRLATPSAEQNPHGHWAEDNDEDGQELEDAKYRKGLRKSRSVINIGGFKFTQHLDRSSKSYSDHDIPNIVVQSPTTDEDKDFSAAFKRRYSSRKTAENDRRNGHTVTRTSYYSDTGRQMLA